MTTTDTTTPAVHVLRIGHGTSRGRDTYGYHIVSLTDETTGKRVRCMGGGYDMVGTVVADWAEATYPQRLLALAPRAYYVSGPDGYKQTSAEDSLYGVTVQRDGEYRALSVTIDGACGESSVWRALNEVGIRATTRTHDRRGNTTGWIVTVGGAR